MLERISRTPSFKRDWKRLKRKHYDEAKLRTVVELLVAEDKATLQSRYDDHALKGQWEGFRELHIQGDWLLIYCILRNELRLVLTRTGSHDILFTDGAHVPDISDPD